MWRTSVSSTIMTTIGVFSGALAQLRLALHKIQSRVGPCEQRILCSTRLRQLASWVWGPSNKLNLRRLLTRGALFGQQLAGKCSAELFPTLVDRISAPATSVFTTLVNAATSEAIAPLYYLPFMSHKRAFVGMVDSGSQLNLVHSSILKLLSFSPVRLPTQTFKGVQGTQTVVKQWIAFTITLQNSQPIAILCGVTDSLPCSVLLGQPFLLASQAVVDYNHGTLTTKRGPCELLARSGAMACNATTAASCPVNLDQSALTESQKMQVMNLINSYRHLWQGGRIGRARTTTHKIKLKTTNPIRDWPRSNPYEHRAEIKKQIEQMLKDSIIQPSHSPHAAEVVMAKKQNSDGTFTGWRFCIDYRKLNEQTVLDAYPLPRISDLLHSIHSSTHFVALDLKAGYWQIPVEETSRKYTAFRCFLGLFEFLVMPFGLTNAPATFQRLVDNLFGEYRLNGVLVYLDDILVHSSSFDKTLALLRVVFDRLAAEGLTINLEKSSFFPKLLKYLGHIIEEGTMRPNPAKLQPLHQLKRPETLYDVRRLLGLIGYYHTYIPNLNGILTPVFQLLKGVKSTKKKDRSTYIEWKDEHASAVNLALEALSKAVLALPRDADEFALETDASADSIAGVLTCKRGDKWAPVAFISKKLTDCERRWPVRDREAWAIVYSVKKFEPFLRGRHFSVFTDHQSLKWLLSAKDGRLARWASRLSEFHLTIYHKTGAQLEHVDYLTRYVDHDRDGDVADRMLYESNLLAATELTVPTVDELIAGQRCEDSPTGRGFMEKDGVVYYHGSIYVPETCRNRVIFAFHSVHPFRHPGIKKTVRMVQRSFNWPGAHNDVVNFIKSCLHCQTTRPGTERLQGLFRTQPMKGPFEIVHIDTWKCYFNNQHHVVLTMIDFCTKWAECVPLPTATGAEITTALLKNWVCRFGVPDTIIMDNERAISGVQITQLLNHIGAKKLTITPKHPEGNAAIESFHRTLKKGLQVFTDDVPFDEALQLVLYSYRCTLHLTTGETPAFLLYGLDPRPPLNADIRFVRNTPARDRIKFLNLLRLEIQWRAYQRRLKANEASNKYRQPGEFEEGQLVLVRATEWDRSQHAFTSHSPVHKLIPKWTLPYRVTKVYHGAKKALVRSLITGTARLVHIQDVRFISPPTSVRQQVEWQQLLQNQLSTVFDEKTRAEVLTKFWEAVKFPQFDVFPATSSKRPRSLASQGLGSG